MALINTSIYNQQPRSFLREGLDGYDRAMQAGDLARQRRDADAKRRQAEAEAKQNAEFERTFKGLTQINDPQTPEGRTGLVRDLNRLGYGKQAMGLMGNFQEMFPEAKPAGYQSLNLGEGGLGVFNPNTGETKIVAPRDTSAKDRAEKFAAEKEAWDRNYKERQLRQAGANTSKDNELAASKFELGKAKTEADMARKAIDIPEMEAKADAAVSLIDEMIGSIDGAVPPHPGLSSAVGMKGASSLWGLKPDPIGGTDAADFNAILDQVKGGAFMEAVQGMKGLGTLTETEGRAATSAISRMKSSQSEKEFIKAARDFQTAIKGRKARTIAKATGAQPAPSGLPPDKARRLQELRAKRDAGTLK